MGESVKIKENIQKLTTTQKNLSKALGLTPQRITQLIGEKIIIRDEEDTSGGVYIFESVKNYYSAKTSDGGDLNYWDEKARHERIKRETSELKLAKLQHEMYDAKTVETVMLEQNITVRTKLLNVAGKLSGELENRPKEEIYKILTEEMEEILQELSEYKPELFESELLEDEDSG